MMDLLNKALVTKKNKHITGEILVREQEHYSIEPEAG